MTNFVFYCAWESCIVLGEEIHFCWNRYVETCKTFVDILMIFWRALCRSGIAWSSLRRDQVSKFGPTGKFAHTWKAYLLALCLAGPNNPWKKLILKEVLGQLSLYGLRRSMRAAHRISVALVTWMPLFLKHNALWRLVVHISRKIRRRKDAEWTMSQLLSLGDRLLGATSASQLFVPSEEIVGIYPWNLILSSSPNGCAMMLNVPTSTLEDNDRQPTWEKSKKNMNLNIWRGSCSLCLS